VRHPLLPLHSVKADPFNARVSSITDDTAAYRFVSHNLYIWPAYPAADAGLWHARGSHIHFVFAHGLDYEGDEVGDEEDIGDDKSERGFYFERTILTFRHVDDIGAMTGPRVGALGGGFRFEVDVDGFAERKESEGGVGALSKSLGEEAVNLGDMLASVKWFWSNRSGASGERWRGIGEGEERLYLLDWEGLLLAGGRVRDAWFGTGA